MGNNHSMSRENKKNQLRKQVVPAAYPKDEDSEEILRKAHQRTIKRRLRIAMIIGILAALAAAGLFYYDRYQSFADYQVVWESGFTEDGQGESIAAEGKLLRLCGFCRRCDQIHEGRRFLSGRQGKSRMDFKL